MKLERVAQGEAVWGNSVSVRGRGSCAAHLLGDGVHNRHHFWVRKQARSLYVRIDISSHGFVCGGKAESLVLHLSSQGHLFTYLTTKQDKQNPGGEHRMCIGPQDDVLVAFDTNSVCCMQRLGELPSSGLQIVSLMACTV